MREYGFSLTHILPYKDRIGEYGSVKTRILAYFMQGLAIYIKQHASARNFTKSNTPPWVSFTFFKLYKWYQIAQNTTYNNSKTRSVFWKNTF